MRNAGVEYSTQEITLVKPDEKKKLLEKANRAKCPLVFVDGVYKAYEDLETANECGDVSAFLFS